MFRADEAFSKRFLGYARSFVGSGGMRPSVLRSMRELKAKVVLTPQLYCTWIETLAAAGERSELRSVLAEMRNKRVVVNLEHYKNLLNAMSSFREYNTCVELVKDMLANGIVPTPEFITSLQEHDNSEGMSPVLDILHKSKTTTKPQPWPTSTTDENVYQPRIENHTPFAQHLIDAVKHANDEGVRALLAEMLAMHANVTVYNSVINHAPNERIAWKILNGMLEHGIEPTHFTFNTLLRIPMAKGLKGCVDVLNMMKKHGIAPDAVTYNQLIQLRVNELDKDGTMAFYQMMKKKNIPPTIFTFNQLLHLARKLRDKKWYEEVKREFQQSGLEANTSTYNLLQEPDDIYYWK